MKPLRAETERVPGWLVFLLFLSMFVPVAVARDGNQVADSLGLPSGFLKFSTPDFHLKLVKDSQTIAALEPKGAEGFDFTPAGELARREENGEAWSGRGKMWPLL